MTNNIERTTSSQEVARTYAQNAEASRAAAAAAQQRIGRAAQGSTPAAPPVQASDSVALSESARSLANAREAVQNAPDVREQRVSQIKQQVGDGTYQVPARVLARKLLDQS